MRTESDKLLVNSYFIRPDSALGEKSVFVNRYSVISKYFAESLFKLIAVSDGILTGYPLNLVGKRTDMLYLLTHIGKCLFALSFAHSTVACYGFIENSPYFFPLSVSISFGLYCGEYFGIPRNAHNADIVRKSKLIAKSFECSYILLCIRLVKSYLSYLRAVILKSNIYIDLRTRDSIFLNVCLDFFLKVGKGSWHFY